MKTILIVLFLMMSHVTVSLSHAVEQHSLSPRDQDARWEEYIRQDLLELRKDVKTLNDLVLKNIAEQNERIKQNERRVGDLWKIVGAIALVVFGALINFFRERLQNKDYEYRRVGMEKVKTWENGKSKISKNKPWDKNDTDE